MEIIKYEVVGIDAFLSFPSSVQTISGHTSVLAQLQLIAVHKKMFISNIIRNKTPRAIVSHNSQAGLTPPSSQSGEITEKIMENKFSQNGNCANVFFSNSIYMEHQLDLKQRRWLKQEAYCRPMIFPSMNDPLSPGRQC